MRKISKAGLLIVTLVIPALIFVFLKFFARNHYDLPYFNPERDAQGNVVRANGDTIFQNINKICPAIGNKEIIGKLTLVSSLSGDCDGDCELFVDQLQRISDLSEEISDLQILTLTDTLRTGNVFLEKLERKKWSFIKVSENVIDSCLQIDSPLNKQTTNPERKWRLVLIDKRGYVRGYYNGSDVSETDRLMAEIKILDYEGKTSEE